MADEPPDKNYTATILFTLFWISLLLGGEQAISRLASIHALSWSGIGCIFVFSLFCFVGSVKWERIKSKIAELWPSRQLRLAKMELTKTRAENEELKRQLNDAKNASTRSTPPATKLVIHRAAYAVGLLTEEPVTDQLNNAARDAVVITVDNGLGGLLSRDPAPGVRKRLEVEYSYGNNIRHSVSRMEPPPGSGQIVRLVLPEDTEVQRLDNEISGLNAQVEIGQREKNQLNSELWRAKESYRQCEEERRAADKKLKMFTALQLDAIYLASEVWEVLKEVGPCPPPKYSADEINRMSAKQAKVLIESNDPDYAEACEYHFGTEQTGSLTRADFLALVSKSKMLRLFKWWDQIGAAYNLKLHAKVETMRDRFVLAGIPADRLKSPPWGKEMELAMRTLGDALWEMAGEAGKKEALGEGI